jgi:hypothetical protein
VPHRPATTAAATTTVARPPATTRRRVTTTAVAAARWVWAPADTFADAARTDAMWQAWTSGAGVHAADHGGRLEIAVDGDAQPDADGLIQAGFRLRCMALDDFDAQVDFQLIDWPVADGVEVTLGFGVGDGTNGAFWSVGRVGGGNRAAWEAYVASVGQDAGVETEDLTGTLRLARRNKVLTAYYKGAAGWVRIASARESRFGNVMLLVATDRHAFGGRTAVVAYDNFSATVPNLFCAGPYFPPRARSR